MGCDVGDGGKESRHEARQEEGRRQEGSGTQEEGGGAQEGGGPKDGRGQESAAQEGSAEEGGRGQVVGAEGRKTQRTIRRVLPGCAVDRHRWRGREQSCCLERARGAPGMC